MSAYLVRRWRGEVALRTLLWRDMVLVGTAINLVLGVAALVVLARGAPLWLVLLLHFAATPYNIFLAASALRSTHRTVASTAIAMLWLAVVTLL
ncbi:MAG: hypothetical protein EOO24_28635 [Comamonadaceae bacterium]|nr:MAG: hypothetical protein EOO24_28635 [Comamonadaceae bacterium]